MKKQFDNLALCIPTRNRAGILATTLQEFRKAGLGEAELWVYDDCSSDPKAIQKVVADWPHAHLIRGKTRVGQAQGVTFSCEVAARPLDCSWMTTASRFRRQSWKNIEGGTGAETGDRDFSIHGCSHPEIFNSAGTR